MTRFLVATEALTAAGALIGASDTEISQGQASLSGADGACLDTPAQWPWTEFLTNAGLAVTSTHDAVSSLSVALREAAYAYASADGTAASSLAVKNGG